MIIGIDLGTTNSLAAVWKDGKAQLIPNALGEFLTPSVVGVDDNGEILAGAPAHERLVTAPGKTASVFKRLMGTNREKPLGGRNYRAEELSAFVLRSLKADAEAWLGEPVDEAVISVPAYFNDSQRKATRAAGQLAGLKVERLINEPTTAALAYGLDKGEGESKFLIFDLGGGTFDVSVLELFSGVMEVRASAGDNFLGGEDFVGVLMDEFLAITGFEIPEKRLWSRKNDGSLLLSILHDQAERAKRHLSTAHEAEMRIHWEGKDASWKLTRDDLDYLIEPLLARISLPIQRALRDARIRPAELDEVVLVGGATRMVAVRHLAGTLFGRLPASHINPEEVVALGAAVQAALKSRDEALDEVVLTDVCPYTLGIEVSEKFSRVNIVDGKFLPIIERNSTVPTSRVERIHTLHDHQRHINVSVFQGESTRTKDNIPLGALDIAVPAGPAGSERVDVRFTYDINGLLEVEATAVSTGITRRKVIEQNPGVLSAEEIRSRFKSLSKIKVHPRENIKNRALLARAERLYAECLGEIRTLLDDHISTFEAILNRQDVNEIEKAQEEFNRLLNDIETTS